MNKSGDIRDQVLGQVQHLIKKRFKTEALKKIPPEMIENAVDEALKGCTNFDLTLAIEHSNVLCMKCGECCRRNDPIIVDVEDVIVIASFLGCEYYLVVANYTKQLKDGRLSLRTPCPFLQGNHCSIYPARPKTCRSFPFIPQGEHITLGLYPYCKFTVNFIVEKTLGFLMIKLIQRETPALSLAIKKYMENLGRCAPSKQTQQILFFKKWIENQQRHIRKAKGD